MRVAELRTALLFYAHPYTYHAIGIWPDPPCGMLVDDFGVHGHPDYEENDERPGQRARDALAPIDWDAADAEYAEAFQERFQE